MHSAFSADFQPLDATIIFCRGGIGGAVGSASSVSLISATGGAFVGTLTAPANSVIVPAKLGVRGIIVNPGAVSGQVGGGGGGTP